jgi:predicted dehydrogenase
VVDPSPDAVEFARELGVPAFQSLAELFARNKPDGVLLATPNQLHVDQGLECIEARVPALVEKPVADTVERGLELAEAAERAGAKMLVGHHRAHSAIMAKAVEVIGSGSLGDIVAVVGTALFYKPSAYFDAAWRRQPGGGPILLNLIHEIGNLRALAGEIAEVQAFASNRTRGFPVEDTASINLRFASGALGTFLLSDTAATDRSWEHTSNEDKFNYAAAHTDRDDCYLVSGTRGSLAIPTMRLQRYPTDADRSWHKPLEQTTIALEDVDPLAAQIAHFCEVIRGTAKPRVSVRDGLQNLRVVDAIREAARTGQIVRIDPS